MTEGYSLQKEPAQKQSMPGWGVGGEARVQGRGGRGGCGAPMTLFACS